MIFPSHDVPRGFSPPPREPMCCSPLTLDHRGPLPPSRARHQPTRPPPTPKPPLAPLGNSTTAEKESSHLSDQSLLITIISLAFIVVGEITCTPKALRYFPSQSSLNEEYTESSMPSNSHTQNSDCACVALSARPAHAADGSSCDSSIIACRLPARPYVFPFAR